MSEKKYKVIFHLDLDAFFCSVEETKYPFLKGKPFAIGNEKQPRSVISTSSYTARKYNVRSAMSVQEALKNCPNLILVNSDYKSYSEFSKKFFDILYSYTNNIVQASIDEAYMDATDLVKDNKYYELALEIQNRVKNELNITVSIGIAPNIFLAKMASDLKKPNGISILRKRDFLDIFGDKNINIIHGLGKKSCERLNEVGINLVKELLYPENKNKIISKLSENHYEDLINRLQGNSSNILEIGKYDQAQSISSSHTFSNDLEDFELILNEFKHPIKDVLNRIKNANTRAKTITITIKYNDFTSIVRSKTLDLYTDQYTTIEYAVYDLFEENWDERPVRLVGVGLSNFEYEEIKKDSKESNELDEYNLFNYFKFDSKQEQIDELLSYINKKFNKEIIFQTKSKNKTIFDNEE